MIEHFDIHFIHADSDEKLQKYVTKKIGRLDHYIPRSSRSDIYAEVSLKVGKTGKQGSSDCCAEVSLHLPYETINVSETSLNMFTAIDIVEQKLKLRIKKYKDQHYGGTLKRRLAIRLVR